MLRNFQEVFCNFDKSSESKLNEIIVPSAGFANNRCTKIINEAGGLSFNLSEDSSSSRCFLWKANENFIDLAEISFHENLNKNFLKLSFSDVHIIDSPNLFYLPKQIVILVSTTTTLYRFIFSYEASTSFFKDCNQNKILSNPQNNSYIFPSSASHYFISATAYQSLHSCLFVLSTTIGSIILVRMPPIESRGMLTSIHEIRQPGFGVVTRLLSGIVPSVINMKSGNESHDAILSLCSWFDEDAFYIASVGRDYKLKLFSAETKELKAIVNFLENANIEENQLKNSLAEVRVKVLVTDSKEPLLSIMFAASINVQFLFYNVRKYGGKYNLDFVFKICDNEELRIIDYALTKNYLWVLHTGKNNFNQYPLYPVGEVNMSRVVMAEKPLIDIHVQDNLDPRFVFTDYIFCPGRFTNSLILKALSLYKQISATSYQPAHLIPRQILKAEVCFAVESEIQALLSEQEADTEEFIDLQIKQWSKFYKCCLQYYEVGCKSLGLFTDHTNCDVFISKESGVGVILPLDILSNLYYNNSLIPTHVYTQYNRHFKGGPEICEMMSYLSASIKNINNIAGVNYDNYFYNQIVMGMDFQIIGNYLRRNFDLDINEGIENIVIATLEHIGEYFIDCIQSLLELFDSHNNNLFNDSQRGLEEKMIIDTNILPCSLNGRKLWTSAVYQTCLHRYKFLRDMYILFNYALNMEEFQHSMNDNWKIEEITYRLINEIKTYHSFVYISQISTSSPELNLYDKTRKICEILKIYNLYPNLQSTLGDESMTQLELFLIGFVSKYFLLKQQISDSLEPATSFLDLNTLVDASIHMMYPSFNQNFAINLLIQSQHVQLFTYFTLISDLTQMQPYSKGLLLAISYLACGESFKAMNLFVEIGKHLVEEEFIMKLFEQSAPHHLIIDYYLLIIRLFEEMNLSENIIYLSKIASPITIDTDIQMNLWIKRFKHQLDLKLYDDAYSTLFEITDYQKLKIYLRQFLSVLCENCEYKNILEYNYSNVALRVDDQVIEILESKARSSDISKDNYYDLLYAMHFNLGNYKEAANVMYEYAFRIGIETSNEEGLQKQLDAYAICLNALHLTPPNKAWIVCPDPSFFDSSNYRQNAPKRAIGGNLIEVDNRICKYDVMDHLMVQREKYLIDCQVKLVEIDKSKSRTLITKSLLQPHETVNLLVSKCMFDEAFDISRLYQLSLEPIFQSLINKCISLTTSKANESDFIMKSYDWLKNLEFITTLPDHWTHIDKAWSLLEYYLNEFEKDEFKTEWHKICAKKMIFYEFNFPAWFCKNYKKRNVDELIRLYMDADLLNDAVQVSIEYLQAASGKGKEIYGLQDFLHSRCSSIWIPYETIDILAFILENIKQEDDQYYLALQMRKKLIQERECHFRRFKNTIPPIITK